MSTLERICRQYWFIVIPAVGLLIGLTLKTCSLSAERRASQEQTASQGDIGLVRASEESLRTPDRPQRRTPKEEAEAQVQQYHVQLRDEPVNENTPAILMAMGNLYRQRLLNYEEAARCYERVIEEFPGAMQISDAYVQLSTCYQRMNALEKANRLHLQMLERFPEDAIEHQFARDQLGWEAGTPTP